MIRIKLDRYVSELELQKAFECFVEETGYGRGKDLELSRVSVDDILTTIDRFATTDVVKLEHGRWIGHSWADDSEIDKDCQEWECSVCGSRFHFEDAIDLKDIEREFPHCPKCIAVMSEARKPTLPERDRSRSYDC